jgi:hypothetical protein
LVLVAVDMVALVGGWVSEGCLVSIVIWRC